MKTRYWIALLILACSLFLLASTPILAEEPVSRRVIRGRVLQVSDEGVVLEVPGASWQVSTGGECRVWSPGQTGARIDDLGAGDAVLALGRRGRDSSFTPRFMVAASPTWLRQHAFGGTVRRVGLSSLVVDGPSGERVLRMDEGCRLKVVGSEDASWMDIAEGDEVVALGGYNKAREFVPRVLVADPGAGLSRTLLLGRIVATKDGSITVQGVSRRVSVSVDEDAQWRAFGGEEAGLSKVEVDSYLAVVVTQDGDGQMCAQTIASVPRKAMKANFVRGEVIGVEADCLVLDTPGGRMRVLITDSTSFRARVLQLSSLLDMLPGDQAIIVGRRLNEREIEAHLVGLVSRALESESDRSQR
ncbi:MAG: hypothetical protein ABIK79_08700 [Chloroflexota bacterium]